MSVITVLLTCCGIAAALPGIHYPLEQAEVLFEKFILVHQKRYAHHAEKQTKFEIFKQNLININHLNSISEHTVYDINLFSDQSHEEFRNTYTGLKPGVGIACTPLSVADVQKMINSSNLPEDDSFDWRDQKVVTPVKSQGGCGSCYSFSAIGNIESQYAMKHGQFVDLSEQQAVDCSSSNLGCQGGDPQEVMRYIINAGGVMNEADYPYLGYQAQCNFNVNAVQVRLTDCISYANVGSQQQLKQLLRSNGPISIAICAEGLRNYAGGVLKDAICTQGNVNHAVLLVGYGTGNQGDYWIVKNSWGSTWGLNGYFMMERGENASSCKVFNQFMCMSVVQ